MLWANIPTECDDMATFFSGGSQDEKGFAVLME